LIREDNAMQLSMNLSVTRRGEVFKVVSDRGTGGHDLFSCIVDDDRFVRTYVRDGEPVHVEHPLCFLDPAWAGRHLGIWRSMRPSWRFSLWRGGAEGIREIDRVCGDLSMTSPDVIRELWSATIIDPMTSGERPDILRCSVPPSTVICEVVALISEV